MIDAIFRFMSIVSYGTLCFSVALGIVVLPWVATGGVARLFDSLFK